MNNEISLPLQGLDSAEIQEWLESLDAVLQSSGPDVRLTFWNACARTLG